MNKERRNTLLEANDYLDDAIRHIQDVIWEEGDALNNLPDSFRYSDRGYSMEEAIEEMEGFIAEIEAIQEKISDYCSGKKPEQKKSFDYLKFL